MLIPKPVKEQKMEEDKQLEYLKEWKRLFEAINPGIKVTLYTEKNFKEILDITYGNIKFEYYCYSRARIVVTLPGEFKLNYLVGMTLDQMFSESEVLSDPLIHVEDPYPCEPETKTWSEFYRTVCDIERANRKEIPQPPDKI